MYKSHLRNTFSYTTDISGSKYNIAFPNNTCKNISKEMRKKENGQSMKKEKANLQRIHQSWWEIV